MESKHNAFREMLHIVYIACVLGSVATSTGCAVTAEDMVVTRRNNAIEVAVAGEVVPTSPFNVETPSNSSTSR